MELLLLSHRADKSIPPGSCPSYLISFPNSLHNTMHCLESKKSNIFSNLNQIMCATKKYCSLINKNSIFNANDSE